MNYKGEIIIGVDEKRDLKSLDDLYSALQPEAMQEARDRSQFVVHKLKDKIRISINARDSVALRATLNNLTKLLTVYEKVGE